MTEAVGTIDRAPSIPTPRTEPSPQVVVDKKISTETGHGAKDKLRSFFRKEKSSPQLTPELRQSTNAGVVAAINTGDIKEANAQLDYAASKDTREAAFATREKHIEYQKAMQEPLNDQTLAKSFLEARIDAESKSNGGQGTGLDKDYARKRIEASYRAKAAEAPSVIAAKSEASKDAYEAEIQNEINRLVIVDAKADLALRLEREKTASDGIAALAQEGSGAASGVEQEDAGEGENGSQTTETTTAPEAPAAGEKSDYSGNQSAGQEEVSEKAAIQPLTQDELSELRKLQATTDLDEVQGKRRETLERRLVDSGQKANLETAEYMEKHGIKNPEKTHRASDMTQEEAAQRLEKAAVGDSSQGSSETAADRSASESTGQVEQKPGEWEKRAQELTEDPLFKKLKEEEALSYLKNKDSEWFADTNFSGEVSDNGYLLDTEGNVTPYLPSQNVSVGIQEVTESALRRYDEAKAREKEGNSNDQEQEQHDATRDAVGAEGSGNDSVESPQIEEPAKEKMQAQLEEIRSKVEELIENSNSEEEKQRARTILELLLAFGINAGIKLADVSRQMSAQR